MDKNFVNNYKQIKFFGPIIKILKFLSTDKNLVHYYKEIKICVHETRILICL